MPTRLHVSFPNEGDLAKSLLTNFSRKGVFVETRHPVEIGARLELSIHLTTPRRELRVPAEVVSHGWVRAWTRVRAWVCACSRPHRTSRSSSTTSTSGW